jgi:cell division protein FtsX
MALAAQRANIAWQVLFSGARTAFFGCALGMIGSQLISWQARVLFNQLVRVWLS